MIAAVLWAAALLAPGTVTGLEPAYEGKLLDSGALILRDLIAPGISRPPEEIAVLVRLECEPLVIEEAADRWRWRWATVDTFAVRDARTVVITSEDDTGPWSRGCRVSEVWSCYLPHSQMWLDTPSGEGGLDTEATYAEVLASVRGWSRRQSACTRARIVGRRGKLEVRT